MPGSAGAETTTSGPTIHTVDPADRAMLAQLPWDLPLADWPTDLMGGLPRGISRHIVRFIENGDELLAMGLVAQDADPDVFVVFENGLAKRTPVSEYRLQGRGGLGIRVAKLPDDRGHLAGAAVVEETDELLVVMERGRVVRSKVSEVPPKGRTTMGVTFAKPDKGDRILLVTTGPESELDEDEAEKPVLEDAGDGGEGSADSAASPASADEAGGEEDVEISDTAASATEDEQGDALGSDESETSPDDADQNEE